MKTISRFYRRIEFINRVAWMVVMLAGFFFMPSYEKVDRSVDNIYRVFVNGTMVGVTEDSQSADECLTQARRELAAESDTLLLIDQDVLLEGNNVLFGKIDSKQYLKNQMKQVLQDAVREDVKDAYTVKVNNYTVNLASKEEVTALLRAALQRYDDSGSFGVVLEKDTAREFNVLTARVEKNLYSRNVGEDVVLQETGIWKSLREAADSAEDTIEKDFSDYDLGLIDMHFKEKVEIVENVIPEEELSTLEAAIEAVTKEEEVPVIYEVVSGDTLSDIAMENNLTIEDLIAMNSTLESANSLIRVGDELTITVPEPELSVIWTQQLHYEEDYEAPIQYIPNDDWYTNQTKTLQQPSAGHREVIAIVTFQNTSEIGTDVVKEDVAMEAVPKIMERGTKIPPTFIRPLSGGRVSSGFGYRKRPTAGASTYHKGIDYSVPVGTAVMASCGGTVIKAGWASGLGNSVTLSHPDGRQTVYGHLSKVLVSVGQTVSQGQKIALSGNTGISTGPHLHFSMIVGGTYVNPANYLQ